MNYKIQKTHSLLHDTEEEWSSVVEGFGSKVEAENYLIKENFNHYKNDIYCSNGYGICTTAVIKEDDKMSKQEIFEKAMEEASSVLGADPAYFGKEGEEEVERQLNKLGYTLDELREGF